MTKQFFKTRTELGLFPEFVASQLGMDTIRLVEIEQEATEVTEAEFSALCKFYGLSNYETPLKANPLVEKQLGMKDALAMANFKEMMKGRI